MTALRVAVIGAGVIGRTHIETMALTEGLTLSALVDPADAARGFAAELGVAHFPDATALIEARAADAVIVAAPNDAHRPLGEALMRAGLPVLMEKPVATTAEDAAALVRLSDRTGAPMLVGHHRRHNPLTRAAKAAIAGGALGDLVMATVTGSLAKPAEYFVAWRTAPGHGGPLLINMIHEVDLLRHFWGEVTTVRGLATNDLRGLPVEDSAAAILTFADGGLATLAISDGACGPWAWDISAGESRGRFPAHDVSAHLYAGTKGGLSLPDLRLWRHPGAPDWVTEMSAEALARAPGDAYVNQLAHFRDVARGEAEPLVSGLDGLRNMLVIDAIKASSETGATIDMASFGP